MIKSRIFSFLVMLILVLVIGCGKLPDDRLLEKGKTAQQSQNYTESVEAYEKLVKIHPTSPLRAEALYLAGLVYANDIKDFEKAVDAFQRAADIDMKSKFAAQSQFMIGFVYANSIQDTVKAKEAYEKFLENYPDHELVSSVEWELKYLGKDINMIPELMQAESK